MIVMEEKKKKTLLTLLILLALIILVGIGGSFAYFTASVSSEKDAVNVKAAVFEIDLEDDISLIKDNIIPSAEKYVDIASKRQDENGIFLKPTVDTDGKTITKGTTCIDDNLNEICSIYTFTIINKMTDSDVPLYITINPNVNTFKNDLSTVASKDDALTALIHLGYLGYDADRKSAYIPNYEVASAFELALETGSWNEVAKSISKCDELLDVTIDGEADRECRKQTGNGGGIKI